jgi:protein-disulfide isomerase
MQEQSNAKVMLGIVGMTVLIFAGLAWAIIKAPSDTNTGVETSVTFSNDDTQPFQGPKDAKVTVHIYGDLQCPACKLSEPPLKAAMAKYQDRVKFVWKDFPLPIHRNAKASALAARCAYDQGWFWKMHDELYDHQEEWSELTNPQPKFEGYANDLASLGLDVNRWKACVADNTGAMDKVQEGVTEGLANHVDRTPTYFINNRRYFSMTEQEWTVALDAALAGSSASSTR